VATISADPAPLMPQLIVLTLERQAIAGITWFADTGVFSHFGLPPEVAVTD
jgi:hypothetical protein